MFTIRATDHTGPKVYACGTADQALDKADELKARGFSAILIRDPQGKDWTAEALERHLDRDV